MTPAPRTAQILVVDDDVGFARLLALRLSSAGHEVSTAASGAEALTLVADELPDVVITDLRMAGMDGMELFEAFRRRSPTLPVILLTAHGTIPDAVAATRRGVFAYLTKPINSQELMSTVADALKVSQPESEAGAESAWRANILGRSPAIQEVLRMAQRVAGSDASVLISGESGTGKELLARAIHKASRRAKGPFVAVNCASVPEPLLESELFGHKKGAFTGAHVDRIGLLRSAEGGILFLDEVADMPLPFQAKLLRTLQSREVRAVGATDAVPVDVRVMSASHTDLRALAAEGRFREDLLYRLDVVELKMPPLRDRRDDIPVLAQAFAKEVAARDLRPAPVFAPEAMEVLVGARWPGNVRQLRNVVEYCVAITTGGVIPADTARDALRERPDGLPTLDDVRANAERTYLVQLLRLAEGNVTKAARAAGRNRTEFYKLLARHNLDPARFRDAADADAS